VADQADPRVSRRNFVVGTIVTVGAGVAGYVVASNSDAAKAKDITTAANDYGYNAPTPGKQLARVSEIPPDGGLILPDAGIVLVRNETVGVRAFSATCTHQGCAVTDVRDGQIICPCHGSTFSVRSGAVTHGPAQRRLPTIPVSVDRGVVYSEGSR
jgi:Rieske Fe-S protein